MAQCSPGSGIQVGRPRGIGLASELAIARQRVAEFALVQITEAPVAIVAGRVQGALVQTAASVNRPASACRCVAEGAVRRQRAESEVDRQSSSLRPARSTDI